MLSLTTFNLRCAWNQDSINSFISRAGGIIEKIHEQAPQILCFQEGTDQNIDFLKRTLTDYHIIFNQRNADFGGEGLATAYRKDQFHLLALDSFWLSDTPHMPGSRFAEQSIYPRICQKLLFKRLSDGKLFRLYNVHLDHISEQAKILGIQCVLQHIEADAALLPLPFFILGDFNAEPDSETITFCKNYAPIPVKDLTAKIPVTFHNFGNMKDACKIDYIFADANIAALPYVTESWEDCVNGIYLSDHYPVRLEIAF